MANTAGVGLGSIINDDKYKGGVKGGGQVELISGVVGMQQQQNMLKSPYLESQKNRKIEKEKMDEDIIYVTIICFKT